jgi:predicted transcriptional regulator
VQKLFRCLTIALIILLAIVSAAAAESGGYIVRPAYDLYPEYSELYFTPHSPDTVLLNDPVPTPISLADLPPWILVIIGLTAVTPGIIYTTKYLSAANLPLIGGFKRISDKNIFQNTSRKAIYECVKENPGVQLADMERSTGFSYKNLIYHINLLKNFRKITSSECKNTERFFENSGKFSPEERAIIMHLKHPCGGKILATIARYPGISRNEISTRIGISGPSVSWHMHFLLHDRIIEQEKEGNTVRHYLRDPMIEIYQRYASIIAE